MLTKARRFAFGMTFGTALSGASAAASDETDRPVFVDVVGHGAIRLRLAAGVTAPCDSAENRMLFDGWVSVGRHGWATGADFICYQYTSGDLRESNWSVPRLLPTRIRHVGTTVIPISTD